jgi:pyruvate,water dikinase
MSHTRALDELCLADAPLFGGKSASLGELLAAEIAVPGGFALSTAAFTATLEQAGLAATIAAKLERLNADDFDAVQRASAEITSAIRSTAVPVEVVGEIAERYRELASGGGESEPPVAVRSSAIGEDSQTTTFAGQQDTYLWVRGVAAICDAVRDCWASLFAAQAVSYRAHLAGELRSPAMGVTVQLMVDAHIAGVMFTCNPVSGDPSMVALNASWGLGEAVVAGEVTPDEYLVSKVTGELVRSQIGDKRVEHLPAGAAGGTVRVEVPEDRRACACLDGSHLAALLDVARRVERHFGAHQDIEWAIARRDLLPDSLFVLQSRPVTVMPRRAVAPAGSAIELVMSTFGVRDRA